jgi:gluconate 2-dehydrogenase gamma chain
MMNEQESTSPPRLFFDELQWASIEAAMPRIMPSDDTPSAREAGAISFSDRYLSGLDYFYTKPGGISFLTLHGKRADAWRQQIETLCQRYVSGVQEMNRRSRDRFSAESCHLTP